MEKLGAKLRNIDGKGYKLYNEIRGSFDFESFILHIDHVQGDPFASPSRIRMEVPQIKAKFPLDTFKINYRRIATIDFINRVFIRNLKEYCNKSKLFIDSPGQEVIDRTSVYIDKEKIEVRLEVELPAAGRSILGREAEKIFFEIIPILVKNSLYYVNIDIVKLNTWLDLAENQNYIREELTKRNLLAFIGNGCILPRESGVSDKPLKNPIVFESPKTMEITLNLPRGGELKGMAIGEGITLIVGGGYHGKSILLNAVELGVYNHISGDGREYVITREDGFKLRAEDGRSINNVDISMFIDNLPNKKSTKNFFTENASGSTSQASSISETLESGSRLLMIDEDTSATNFMIRDEKMKALVAKDKEPITPFITRVRSLYKDYGVSSIIVVGSSGEYFKVADKVIMMDEYKVYDVTEKAKSLVANDLDDKDKCPSISNNRILLRKSFNEGPKGIKIKVFDKDKFLYNKCEVDLRALEQLVHSSQTRAIGEIFKYIKYNICDDKLSIIECVEKAYDIIDKKGLEGISSLKGHPGNLALPRKYEVIGALNRFRELKINSKE